jgi:asparagine synthase (glutamine-hydrolysing)
MCGIVGYFNKNGASIDAVSKMALRIKHRGPDGAGAWLNNKGEMAMAHRRLAIVDLTSSGHQPMSSSCGRYTLVFNGEIYNHLELRDDLSASVGHFSWDGGSDTETLLMLLIYWGIENTLKRIDGMFAFAFWDNNVERLFLARDRMGEKPLYYGSNGGCFLFGSELKSLKELPTWQGEIDRDALTLYMRHNYIPAPWCIYKGIKKLLPAHYIVISEKCKNVSKPYCYWNLYEIAERGQSLQDTEVNNNNLVNELDKILRKSVKSRMMADVPLGAFLSGGFDSTMVVALMQYQSTEPIKTFTIGFHEQGYNEAVHAKKVAEYLGTNHTELYLTSEEALSVIPRLPTIWDEPFADSSQIPTLLVSELAHKDVKVSLSGDGGDELFCGYNRYSESYKIWKNLRYLPKSMTYLLSKILEYFPGQSLENAMKILPEKHQVSHLADRLPKLGNLVQNVQSKNYYKNFVSHWKNPELLVYDAKEPQTIFDKLEDQPKLLDFRELMMYLDSMTYLPGDNLTKIDRASMSTGLEVRVPLLDHKVVEFSWKVPMSLKYRNGESKWLLREVLYNYVPRELMERPKMGFRVPVEHWLRGPLRDWCENLLGEKRLKEQLLFDHELIRKKWDEHLSGKRRWTYHLWDVLMFQAWLDEQ